MSFRDSRRRRTAASVLGLAAFALGAATLTLDETTIAEAAKPDAAAAAPPPAPQGEKRTDPDNKTGISKFMETCVQGNGKYLARDFPAAIDLYRQAIQLQPKNPLGPYLLGEAQLAAGNVGEAEASFTQASNVADDRNRGLRAKILFCLADVKERQKKWDEAKTNWKSYVDYAQKVDGGAFPASGTARIQAIDDMLKQDKAYEIVRQRIAAEKDSGK
jgi:tetratricopeptide (TPR) repeat protein